MPFEGSILALRWDYIDSDFMKITNPDHKTQGKTGMEQFVPISSPLRRVLKVAYRLRDESCPFVVQYRPYVKGQPRPGGYRARGIKACVTAIRAACERAGVPYGLKGGITFHTLRHTMATLSATLRLPKDERREMMGHETNAATDVYTHISAEHKRPAVEKVGKAMERALELGKASRKPARLGNVIKKTITSDLAGKTPKLLESRN